MASIRDRASIDAHRNGVTVQDLWVHIERNTIDPIPQGTAGDILEGLRRIGVLVRRHGENEAGNLTYKWMRAENGNREAQATR